MGTQAKLTRARRAQRREETERSRALDDTLRKSEVIQAVYDAARADDELQARWMKDVPGQRERLRAAGWRLREDSVAGAGIWDHRRGGLRLVHSIGRETDGHLWGHTSLSSRDGALPGWYLLRDAQWLLYPGLRAVVVIAPASEHVNISQTVHAWTPLTADVIPDFGRFGTI
jgi:hypothetical protein